MRFAYKRATVWDRVRCNRSELQIYTRNVKIKMLISFSLSTLFKIYATTSKLFATLNAYNVINLWNGILFISNEAMVYATLLSAIQCRFPGLLDLSLLHRGFRDASEINSECYSRNKATETLISIPVSQNPPSKSIIIAWKPFRVKPFRVSSFLSRAHACKCPCVNIEKNTASHVSRISLYILLLMRSKE